MTWIRVDTTLPGEAVIGALAEALDVDAPTALGLYVATQLGFGEHQQDGLADQVTDTSLEQWSGWRGRGGEKGRFAVTFRQHCVERDAGREHKDPPGRVNGWWRQEALFRKQLKDRNRKNGEGDGGRSDDSGGPDGGGPDNPADFPRGFSAEKARNVDAAAVAADGHGNGNGKQQQARALDYVRLCVGAANRGLAANPAYHGRRRYNELTCSAQDVHVEWMRDGIPADTAVRCIYERASRFKPTPNRPQPGGLRYFDGNVREGWEREQAAAATGDLKAERVTAAEQLARQLEMAAKGATT